MGDPGPERLSGCGSHGCWREVDGSERNDTWTHHVGYLLIIALGSQFYRLLQRVA